MGNDSWMVLDEWELMLVKPGMELPLFERCDPEGCQLLVRITLSCRGAVYLLLALSMRHQR
jgi:hypothetical protein